MNVPTVFKGRIRRKPYALYTGALVAAMIALFVVQRAIELFLYPEDHNGGLAALLDVVLLLLAASQFLLGLFATIVTSVLGVRRLHDLGRSGWWMLALLIIGALWPISVMAAAVALLGQLFLMIAPGDEGQNRYGEAPSANGLSALGIGAAHSERNR